MKAYIFFYLLFTFVIVCNSCTENSNRITFTIPASDRKIIVPVQLSDSVIVNLAFDSGWRDDVISIDSAFVASHPSLIPNIPSDTSQVGSSWADNRVLDLIYKTPQAVNIGNTKLVYNSLQIFDFHGAWYTDVADGGFNIPQDDTIHVWEWNFEHNYLEIHSAENFTMPENCFLFPMTEKGHEPNIQIPLQITCMNGDTLTLNRTFFIDMGMADDIALVRPTKEEAEFFNQRDDAVWTISSGGYKRRYTVNATLFDDFEMDSIRIYTFKNAYFVGSEYLIGINFLKRFNVFIDRKQWQIGLQPINNFQRIVNPGFRRFHFSAPPTPDGKYIVTEVANYEANYYKTAGLREGDEIVAVDDKPYKDVTWEEKQEFYLKDTLIYNIIRNGEPLKIIVPVDKNEEQGD